MTYSDAISMRFPRQRTDPGTCPDRKDNCMKGTHRKEEGMAVRLIRILHGQKVVATQKIKPNGTACTVPDRRHARDDSLKHHPARRLLSPRCQLGRNDKPILDKSLKRQSILGRPLIPLLAIFSEDPCPEDLNRDGV
jgi:hypothetical protein